MQLTTPSATNSSPNVVFIDIIRMIHRIGIGLLPDTAVKRTVADVGPTVPGVAIVLLRNGLQLLVIGVTGVHDEDWYVKM